MLLKIHPDNPQERLLQQVIDCIKAGGVIIYPTDTVYGLGCDIYNQKAIERICKIKEVLPKQAQFSFVCSDLSHLSNYTKNVNTPIFRLLKHCLPGPYTFILEANKEVPRHLKIKKDTIGIRIPDHAITQQLISLLGHPIMSMSLPPNEWDSYETDPEEIWQRFSKVVDLVIDGGIGQQQLSTIIDCTAENPLILREGAGAIPASII